MMAKRSPWAALAGLLCALPVCGLTPNRELTQYVHRIWQTQQGLPDGAIVEILQDATGYLWLATEAGLYRFDGVRFTPGERLFADPVVSGYLRAAAIDAQGAFWLAGGDPRITVLRPGGAQHFGPEQGLPGGLIQCFVPDPSGAMWVCTEHGLVRLDPANSARPAKVLRAADGLPNEYVRSACRDASGRMWIGADSPHVTVYGGGRVRAFRLVGLPQAASVRGLLCDGATVWAGTSFGLVRLEADDPTRQRWYTVRDGLVDDFVFTVKRGAGGVLWVGTRNGFARLRNQTWDGFRPQDGLSQSWAQAIFEDREGSLWVGTKRGLNQFVDGRGVPYTVTEGLPSNRTGPVFEDSNGVIWAGTLDAGLARFDGRRFSALTVAHGLPSNSVRTIIEDSGRSLWVGTANGLARLDGGAVAARYGTAEGLPSADIRSTFRDRSGVLWIGTAAGLATLSGGAIAVETGAPRTEIRAIGQDRAGRIVIGTDEGMYVREDGRFRPLAQGGVYLRNANTFFLDPDGLLWAGMNGATLRLIDGDKITAFSTRDGIYDSELYGIALDEQDRMWFACSRGIFWVARADLRRFARGELERLRSVAYTPTDALRVIEGRQGVQPALWRMRDGRLWFSTARGLMALDPAQPGREGAPPVVIEPPLVNGAPVAPEQIRHLPPGQKNIEFNYTGLSYLLPELIRFRYRLIGYDPDWIEAGTRREAFYTNLPPGDYRFQVTACNYDGPCSPEGLGLAFTITPQLYERAWFWPLMALLAGAAGWGGYRLHIRRLRQRYDLIVSERSRIARELHDTLIQGFSGITMALQALHGRIHTAEEREALEEIIRDATACLRETRQSVAGLRNLPVEQTGLAGAVSRAVREITETKAVRTHLDLEEVQRELAPEVEYNLLRIVREAVNNAIKHAGASVITVKLRATREALTVSVRDDGSGFSPERAAGPGHYGIIGMKERAAQIGGQLELVTKPGEGTTITLTLPAHAAAGRTLELSQ
jgi:signal transduction histidine kinase